MNILIDIGHPGHVHYFKYLYSILVGKGHTFKIIARQREVIKNLLDYYDIPYVDRGKGSDSSLGKLFYMLRADILILRKSLRFKPDVFLSFSSPYAAQVAKLLNKPHLALNDTEHTDKTHRKFTYPFSDVIFTPASYQNILGKKQIRLDCTIEYFYLHPKYYTPDPSIYELLSITPDTKYVIVRFVSWNAFHDVNQHGLSLSQKREIISLLNRKYNVFISSERELEHEFAEFQIKIPPHRMHDALAFASLFVGESGTMASESALLGTPVVYINSLPLMCYLKLEQDHGILKHFNSGERVFEYIEQIIQNKDLKLQATQNRDVMVHNFINPTDFLCWFLENYPNSKKLMQENPDYQYNFR
jgi:uncharacterized protein